MTIIKEFSKLSGEHLVVVVVCTLILSIASIPIGIVYIVNINYTEKVLLLQSENERILIENERAEQEALDEWMNKNTREATFLMAIREVEMLFPCDDGVASVRAASLEQRASAIAMICRQFDMSADEVSEFLAANDR